MIVWRMAPVSIPPQQNYEYDKCQKNILYEMQKKRDIRFFSQNFFCSQNVRFVLVCGGVLGVKKVWRGALWHISQKCNM